MAIVLFDTNIIIDMLDGVPEALEVVAGGEYESKIISSINWMEVACQMTPERIADFRIKLLRLDIDVVQTSEQIMVRAAAIRRASTKENTKKTLPDCIIRATAEVENRIVITRNARDFGGPGPFVHVPYILEHGVVSNVRPPLA
ncbi:PIN domain-containing protein [Duganella sp. FT27W]|uniref:PIN domain-containing protein n=1 Tax=Duganella sp. FT27W TaxID=2654636 RepID=UPI00128DA0E5|nr:PIN domain-containing protein [Duganella sp. FT27W]MPQ56274.1 PIN domain-containing protein [Duganella sp. FT27W]